MANARARATSVLGPVGAGQVEPARFTATRAKNEFGRILDTVLEGGTVVITKHDTPKAVLISVDRFKTLAEGRELALNSLTDEFDALFAQMQTSEARKSMQAAFEASPKELAKAAVIAARKRV